MPPTVYRRKKVLGQKTRYREKRPDHLLDYGDSDSVNNFIQGQRGGNAPDVHDIFRRYAVDILGWPHATAEHYASQDCPILDGLTPSGR